MATTVQLVVSGIVQGVGFRWWTVRTARDLGLDGWVRNLYDGRVEILARGSQGALRELEQACWQGPRSADVSSVVRVEGLGAEVPGAFTQAPSAAEPLG